MAASDPKEVESCGMWDAIRYVTSGFTLVAFLAAVAAGVFWRHILQKEKLIRTAPEESRGALVASALEFFDVATERLTKQQQFEIALQQIHARAQRFLLSTILTAIMTVVAGATVLGLSWYGSDGSGPEPLLDTSFQVIDNQTHDVLLRKLIVRYRSNGSQDSLPVNPSQRGAFSLPGRFGEQLFIDDIDASDGYWFDRKLERQFELGKEGIYLIRLARTPRFEESIMPVPPDAPSDSQYESLTRSTVSGGPSQVVFTCINNTPFTVDLFFYRYFPEGEYPAFLSFVPPYGPEAIGPTQGQEVVVWDSFGPSVGGVFFFYGSIGGARATFLDKGYLFASHRPVLTLEPERTVEGGVTLKGTLRHRYSSSQVAAE